MNCDELRDCASGYIDRELTAAEAAQAEAHLATCPGCAREVERLRRTAALLNRLPRLAAPAGLADAVRARIAAQPAAATPAPGPVLTFYRRARPVIQTLALAAAALTIILANWAVVQTGPTSPEERPDTLSPAAREHRPAVGQAATDLRAEKVTQELQSVERRKQADGMLKADKDAATDKTPQPADTPTPPAAAGAAVAHDNEEQGKSPESARGGRLKAQAEEMEKKGAAGAGESASSSTYRRPGPPAQTHADGFAGAGDEEGVSDAKRGKSVPPAEAPPAGTKAPVEERDRKTALGLAPDPGAQAEPVAPGQPARAPAGVFEAGEAKEKEADRISRGAAGAAATPKAPASAPGAPVHPDRLNEEETAKKADTARTDAPSTRRDVQDARHRSDRLEFLARCTDVPDAVGTAEQFLREHKTTFEIRTGRDGRRVLVARVPESERETLFGLLRELEVAQVSAAPAAGLRRSLRQGQGRRPGGAGADALPGDRDAEEATDLTEGPAPDDSRPGVGGAAGTSSPSPGAVGGKALERAGSGRAADGPAAGADDPAASHARETAGGLAKRNAPAEAAATQQKGEEASQGTADGGVVASGTAGPGKPTAGPQPASPAAPAGGGGASGKAKGTPGIDKPPARPLGENKSQWKGAAKDEKLDRAVAAEDAEATVTLVITFQPAGK